MLARVVRSGVIEAHHDGAVAVVTPDGKVLASDGEIDRRYFIRSAAKPFQAMAALEAGAEFTSEQLAVACSSHGAQPIHVAYVEAMLAEVGLDSSALRCPPDWPIASSAIDRLIASGHGQPRRIWHNCSGKHAAMLRACQAAGWPTASYLYPDHPLQQQIRREMSDVFGTELDEPGIDGCGAPVYQVSTRELARGFAVLAIDKRYDRVRTAMQRYGALTARNDLLAAPSRWWDVAAKGGAEGCMGLAVRNRFGVALKAFDGSDRPLGPAVLSVMTDMGVAPDLTRKGYLRLFEVETRGGGEVVGRVESMVQLS